MHVGVFLSTLLSGTGPLLVLLCVTSIVADNRGAHFMNYTDWPLPSALAPLVVGCLSVRVLAVAFEVTIRRRVVAIALVIVSVNIRLCMGPYLRSRLLLCLHMCSIAAVGIRRLCVVNAVHDVVTLMLDGDVALSMKARLRVLGAFFGALAGRFVWHVVLVMVLILILVLILMHVAPISNEAVLVRAMALKDALLQPCMEQFLILIGEPLL